MTSGMAWNRSGRLSSARRERRQKSSFTNSGKEQEGAGSRVKERAGPFEPPKINTWSWRRHGP
jgi:hypothetical protein